jgi:hypothetical protein
MQVSSAPDQVLGCRRLLFALGAAAAFASLAAVSVAINIQALHGLLNLLLHNRCDSMHSDLANLQSLRNVLHEAGSVGCTAS